MPRFATKYSGKVFGISIKKITFEWVILIPFKRNMDDRTKLVESLGKKIDRVLDENRRLRSEALGLTTERDRLLRQKREAENRIRLLEKRIRTLETAGGFLTSRTDRRTARLRVNRLLREIDGCIALMNK
ncbi:hypothetical protein [Alistipes ihumii]|uniref:hypothetical protein n=1 Tax=Alistipes ihumii TaxID=1470347 RepID=UPI003AB30BFF